MTLRSLLAALTVSLFSLHTWAASVSVVKGKRALINLEGSLVSVGDQFFLINPTTQKKAAIIQIQQVKSGKAIAVILKGRGQTGYTLQAKSSSLTGPVTSPETSNQNEADVTSGSGVRPQYGFLFGYLQNKMDASITYSSGLGTNAMTQVSLAGSGLSLGGFYDYTLSKNLFFEGIAAYEQFSVTGTASVNACRGGTTCDANINYLSLYGLLKWYLGDSAQRPWWIGGGGAYMMALSKSASALNESDITVNQALTLAGGMDFSMGNSRYIPVSLHYNYFPDSATVKASSIVLRVGYSFGM